MDTEQWKFINKKMEIKINPKYPSVTDLRKRAMVKMPKFAFEYLDGGCN